MKIAFIHNRRAFLPELSAYQTYFASQNIETSIIEPGAEADSGADVYWYMMGFFPRHLPKKKLIIHEYCSASVPPFRKLKDMMKARLNPRPHFRLYLNDYVRQQINIHDEVPFGLRDMGVSASFLNQPQDTEKTYDFIYAGNLSFQRKLEFLLKIFDQGQLQNRSLLMLGKDEDKLAERFRDCENIYFHDAVHWEKVPGFLSQAKYALNYIPDEEPYNGQTSTKFLEYAAMGIPIISTNYYWISEFQERYGGNYFFLKEDLSNMTWDRIEAFNYAFPDLNSWHWEERIQASGIMDFLKQAKIP